jgi:glycosyltransferase 2 family protein
VKLVIKLLFSSLLILLVLRSIESDEFIRLAQEISLFELFGVCLCYFFGQTISSVKWWLILKSHVTNLPYPKAFKAYFTGMLVNIIGVGTVGGDMTRAMMVSDASCPKTLSLASVIADRVHGLFVLGSIGTLSIGVFGRAMLPDSLVWGVASLGIVILISWFYGPLLLKSFIRQDHFLRNKVDSFLAAFPRKLSTVAYITLVSATFHVWQISMHQLMAHSIGTHIPWTFLFICVPFVNIFSTLPISWQGLGVRENAYKFFFVPAYLKPEQALLMGMIWIASSTFTSLLGGGISNLFFKRFK